MTNVIRFKRGTKAAIDSVASKGGLLSGEPLYFTDLKTVGISSSETEYEILGVNPVILFTAYLNASQTPGAGQPLTNWTVLTNKGGTYSAGAYTVPKSGWYELSISLIGNTNGGGGGLAFMVNSTTRARVAFATPGGASTYYTACGSEFVYLNKNDLVRVISVDNLNWFGDSAAPVGRWNIEFKGT